MFHLLLPLLLAAGQSAAVRNEEIVVRVANVRWTDVVDRLGNHSNIPVFSWAGPGTPPQGVKFRHAAELGLVASLDERFRLAKLANDVNALAEILSDDYFGTNQNGNSRDKAQLIALFRTFPIRSLDTTRATIRSTGTNVIITGEQTEVNATGTDRMLFTRVYVLDAAKQWTLLSSTQFRVP